MSGDGYISLDAGGVVEARPTRVTGLPIVVDLGVIAAEGKRPSAAVYLTAAECRRLAVVLIEASEAS